MQLNVSAIQHFSTGDGDGIRTTVFLKGCNLRCPWCHNPETITKNPVELNYSTGKVVNGHLMEIDDVIDEVMEDYIFYGDDGGVTVSGGEPLLQADAVAELIGRLKEKGVSAVIDTAGAVPYEAFLKLGDLVHTYYFDLKACDAEGYKEVGGDFGLVTENLKKLISEGRRVNVRIPLIPNFNDSAEYSEKMCEVLKSVGASNIDVLPFHRLGSGKYTAMGMTYSYANEPMMTRERANEIAEYYRPYFNVRVDG